MSALQDELPGARVLDLFAGSGALGLEALSRGAEEVVFVERSGRSVQVLRKNIEVLGAGEATRVVRRDVFAYLKGQETGPGRRSAAEDRPEAPPFDLALADPPYGKGLAARLVQLFLDWPFARQLWVEHRVDEELPDESALPRRRYGETILSAYLDPRNAGEP